jgi:hypothetical protein
MYGQEVRCYACYAEADAKADAPTQTEQVNLDFLFWDCCSPNRSPHELKSTFPTRCLDRFQSFMRL